MMTDCFCIYGDLRRSSRILHRDEDSVYSGLDKMKVKWTLEKNEKQ